MPCLSGEQIDRYAAGTLGSGAELSGFDGHLETCAPCRTALRALAGDGSGSLADELAPLRGEAVCPDEELLSRYVDGDAEVGEREWLELHQASCVLCAEDVRSLRETREALDRTDWAVVRAAARPEGSAETGRAG